MLDCEGEIIAIAAQIEVAISPGMELGGPAQRLTGARASSTLFGMVDDEDGEAIAALQLAQVGKQRGDFAAGVLVDAVQPHEGIENEQARPQVCDGVGEAAPIAFEIKAKGRRGDDLDIQIGEVDASGSGDALEPPAHDRSGILGSIEEDTARIGRFKTAQTRNPSSNGNSEIERQERLAALGLAADDADGFMRP